MIMATSRKEIAQSFLREAASGSVRAAFQKHVAPDFRHHNAYFPGNAESLMRGMEENVAKFPNKSFEVKRALEDGDFVAVHSHVKMGNASIAVVHIFRFEGDRIAELWDVGQPVPENSPNQNGVF